MKFRDYILNEVTKTNKVTLDKVLADTKANPFKYGGYSTPEPVIEDNSVVFKYGKIGKKWERDEEDDPHTTLSYESKNEIRKEFTTWAEKFPWFSSVELWIQAHAEYKEVDLGINIKTPKPRVKKPKLSKVDTLIQAVKIANPKEVFKLLKNEDLLTDIKTNAYPNLWSTLERENFGSYKYGGMLSNMETFAATCKIRSMLAARIPKELQSSMPNWEWSPYSYENQFDASSQQKDADVSRYMKQWEKLN